MNIGSHQALVNLLASEHIVSMDRLKDCLQQVSKICSCQKQRKNQKQDECNTLYINFVTLHASDLINYFRNKEFGLDQALHYLLNIYYFYFNLHCTDFRLNNLFSFEVIQLLLTPSSHYLIFDLINQFQSNY